MFEQATRTRLDQLTQYFISHGVIDRVDAAHRAYVAIGKIVQKQAFILGFSDIFYPAGRRADRRTCRGHDAEEARPSRCRRRPLIIFNHPKENDHEAPHELRPSIERNSHVEGQGSHRHRIDQRHWAGNRQELARLGANLVLNGFGDAERDRGDPQRDRTRPWRARRL